MDEHLRRIAAACLAALPALAACVPDPVVDLFAAADLRPPAVVSWAPSSARECVIWFDEAVSADVAAFASSPGPAVLSVRDGPDGLCVIVELAADQEAGAGYAVSGLVKDGSGNASSFVLPYWGHNPDPPLLLMNELLSEGSSTHPDAVEFFAVRGGNLAGLAFFVGSPGDWDARYVFAPGAVAAGDYLVLHMKPSGSPDELDETAGGGKEASGGADASPGAWDLWYRGEGGALPGKNGALALCSSPNGACMDALLYSARTSASDAKYAGFGSAALRDRAGELAAIGAWAIAGAAPAPEDCAASLGTTSTRTLCRASSSADTGAAADWHVAPGGGESLGSANTDEAYAPD